VRADAAPDDVQIAMPNLVAVRRTGVTRPSRPSDWLSVYFLRICGLDLKPAPQQGAQIAVGLGEAVSVEITSGQERGGGRWHRVIGRVKLRQSPKRTGDGYVVIPDEARKAARSAIEIAANVVALGAHSGRRLSSPIPYAAFEAESDKEREWLAASAGIHGGLEGVAINSTSSKLDLDPAVVGSLTDRWDGVALLAEAIGAERGTGQFIDFMRLFERAFRRSVGSLSKPLAEFLDRRFGYEEAEIEHWTTTLRGEAAHADRRATFLMEGDVRPYLHRVEQAGWDVLLNKKDWRSSTTTRRSVWNPTAGTTSARGDLTAVVGSTLPIVAQLVDRWEEFPLDLELRVRMPEPWWPSPPESLGTKGNSFLVVKPEEWQP
jgi:hypothetical protein